MRGGVIYSIFMLFFVIPTLGIHKGFTEEHIAAAKKYLSELNNEMELKQSTWKDPNDIFANDHDSAPKLKPVDQAVNVEEYKTSERGEKRLNVCKKNPENCTEVCQKEMDKSILKNHMYLGRWLKMFLNKFSELTLDGENILISFPVNNLDLNKIQKMLNSKSLSIAAIDEVISGMMSEVTVTYSGDWFTRTVDLLLTNKIFLVVGISVAIFAATYAHPRLFISVLIISACLVWQWMLLYNKEIAKKQASVESIHFPDACQTHKLGIWGAFTYAVTGIFVTRGTCEDYYKALMVDPFWEVTPMKVISEAMITFVLHPVEILAETLNVAILKLFKGMPFITVISFVIILILLFMMMCNYRLRSIFMSFEPSYPPVRPSNSDQVQIGSNTSFMSSILQGVKNIYSFPTSSDQVPTISGTTNDSNNVSFVQACEANSQQTVDNGILKTEGSYEKQTAIEYSPSAKLKMFGFTEGQEPGKLKWKVYSKVKGTNVQKLMVNENAEANEIKCTQEFLLCPSQSSIIHSDNLQIASPNIQKQNIKTEMQDIKTDVKSTETEIEGIKNEINYIETKDIKTEIVDMNYEATDIKPDKIMETDIKDEVKDSYIQPVKIETVEITEESLHSPIVLKCTLVPKSL